MSGQWNEKLEIYSSGKRFDQIFEILVARKKENEASWKERKEEMKGGRGDERRMEGRKKK